MWSPKGPSTRSSSGSTYPSRITSACAGTSMSIVLQRTSSTGSFLRKPENIISSMSSGSGAEAA